MPESPNAILVVGMHRTGTSLTMAALEALDVDIGQHLLPPGPDNETGYWEDEAILDLNDRLMAALGKTWASVAPIAEADWAQESVVTLRCEAAALLRQRFAGSQLWGFKNPRCIRLLPFWQQVLRDVGASAKYVVTFRNPESVAASLAFRNHFARGKSYFLWLGHYVPYLDRLLREQCLFVDYDRLMDEPREAVARMADFVRGTADQSGKDLGKRVEAFLDSTLQQRLRHTRSDAVALDTDAPRVLKDVFRFLGELAEGGDAAKALPQVASLQKDYQAYALLLQQVDESQASADRLQKIINEEEPVRNKIEKIGLYQADIQGKVERIEGRVEDVQEKVVVQIDELHRELAARSESFSQLEARAASQAEAVQRQVETRMSEAGAAAAARMDAMQQGLEARMGELHRTVALELQHTVAEVARADQLTRELDALRARMQAQLDDVYRSASWRITRPLRAIKLLAMKFMSLFGR